MSKYRSSSSVPDIISKNWRCKNIKWFKYKRCKAGGKPSTWFPQGGLAEWLQDCKMSNIKPEKQPLNSQTQRART